MKFKIVTPERVVFEQDNIEAVYALTADGEVGILPQHIPMVAPLTVGLLRYVQAGEKKPVAVMGGILRTNGTEVTVLSDAAELGGDIDVARAEQSRQRAEARLKQNQNDVDQGRAESALSRSIIRIKAAQYTA